MFYLSACAIAKRESRYIEEWVTFHLGVGVEHFYIYDNDYDTSTSEILRSRFEKEVTVIPFYGLVKQLAAYRDCLSRFADASNWIAFLDIDEFLVPHEPSVATVLNRYEKYPCLCAHWYLFGSNGRLVYEDKPVIERFTRRQRDVNVHIKSIVKPKETIEPVTPHKFSHYNCAVDENRHYVEDTVSRPSYGTANIIQINHYVTKSLEECRERRRYPRADTGQIREFDSFYKEHDRNEVEDLTALNLWRAIREKRY